MASAEHLPAEFQRLLASLEASYLESDDPIVQSGFGGGPERWRAEREPLLAGVERDGTLLDIGCANGYLLECLVGWAAERGIRLEPYGLDYGARLIEVARRRRPQYAGHFFVGNGWDWTPPRRFDYVYTLYDCVPLDMLAAYVERLLERMTAPGGRLIVGAYGSRSRGLAPFPIAENLTNAGWRVAGTSEGGDAPITAFAWIERE